MILGPHDKRARKRTQKQDQGHLYMVLEYGTRCHDFEAGCTCCEAWRLFDTLKRPPTHGELCKAIDAATRSGKPLKEDK